MVAVVKPNDTPLHVLKEKRLELIDTDAKPNNSPLHALRKKRIELVVAVENLTIHLSRFKGEYTIFFFIKNL